MAGVMMKTLVTKDSMEVAGEVEKGYKQERALEVADLSTKGWFPTLAPLCLWAAYVICWIFIFSSVKWYSSHFLHGACSKQTETSGA